MTNNDFQKRVQHFATLKTKYQASDYEESSPSSPLYLILRKTDLGIELTEFELNWLKEQKLHQTSQFISQKRVLSSGELLRQGNTREFQQIWLKEQELIEASFELAQKLEQQRHFAELKKKYKATQDEDSSPSSHLYQVLKQIDSGKPLSESNLNFLRKRQLMRTSALAVDKYVTSLKSKVKSGNSLTEAEINWLTNCGHEDIIIAYLKSQLELGNPLNSVEIGLLTRNRRENLIIAHLQSKLELRIQLNPAEIDVLKYNGRDEIMVVHFKSKLELGNQLNSAEINWLKQNGREDIITLAKIASLKSLAESSHAKSGMMLTEDEIDWLKHNGREDIIIVHLKSNLELGNQLNSAEINWLKQNGREDIITLAKIASLKSLAESCEVRNDVN